MDKLSFSSYVKKCVLGTEIAYVVCLIGGYLPFRSTRGTELHCAFETLPGFTGSLAASSGAILFALVAIIVVLTYGCIIQP